MIFESMNEQEIVTYLQGMKQLENNICLRREEIYKKIETLEDCIERINFSHGENIGSAPTGGVKDTAYRVLMRSYEDYDRQLNYYSEQLLEICDEEEQMQYMQQCIRRLPFKQSALIIDIYINGVSVDEYARTNYLSRATVFRSKKRAIGNLIVLYNMRFT